MTTDAPADLRDLWFLNTRVTIRVSARDGTDGIAVLEHRAAFGDSPPLHIHRDEDEIFHVLEGIVRYRVGETDRIAGPGEILLAPRGIPHSYRVESPEGARMLTVTRGGFEAFVRSLGRPAAGAGLPIPAGPPSPAQADALAQACLGFGIELVGPPLG
ncbi:MAG TPA: cupin domain-containing protein [Microvirga sp.]|jgi:quercetin dioxygenase-like cupin family protein|nr:cupin domain-containing protein [Microvirga sp.]